MLGFWIKQLTQYNIVNSWHNQMPRDAMMPVERQWELNICQNVVEQRMPEKIARPPDMGHLFWDRKGTGEIPALCSFQPRDWHYV